MASVTPRNVFIADQALAALRHHKDFMTTKEVATAINHPAPWNNETWRTLDRLTRLGYVERDRISGALVQWKALTPDPITTKLLDPFLGKESPRDN